MKATPEQWHELERHSHSSQPWAPCILELRARVEALEAANSKPAPNDRQIRSSLAERVYNAMVLAAYESEARAAIREVAAWLERHGVADSPGRAIPAWLRQEAER